MKRPRRGRHREAEAVGLRAVAASRRILRDFEPVSVRALLHAACSSPTARQRLTGCVAMLVSAWKHPPTGQRVAQADDLPVLLVALYDAEPGLRLLNDWMPLDPRPLVVFRGHLDDRSWRIPVHPGPIGDPGEVPRQALRYADAVDPVLLERVGIGLRDLMKIAGRVLAVERGALSLGWSDEEVSLESPPSVSPVEVSAAAEYLARWSLDSLISEVVAQDAPAGDASPVDEALPGSDRLARVASLVTVRAAELRLAPGWLSTLLGPVMFVQHGGDVHPVPASLVLQGLGSAITMLVNGFERRSGQRQRRVRSGSRRQPDTGQRREWLTEKDRLAAQQRWARNSRADLYGICTGAAAHVLFPVHVDGGGELLLLATGHRHVIAVELVAALTPGVAAAEVGVARRRLSDMDTDTPLRLETGGETADLAWLGPSSPPPYSSAGEALTWSAGLADALPFPPAALMGEPFTLAAGTVITRLVVVDGPWQPEVLWEGGVPVCTLTEFRELIGDDDGTSTDREELWAFLDEIVAVGAQSDGQGPGVAALQMFSILDAWQMWRDSHMLFPAWLPDQALIVVPPRDEEYGWYRRAYYDALDELLAALDLPGVSDWPTIGPPLLDVEEPAEVITLARHHPRQLLFARPGRQLIIFGELTPVERTPSGRRAAITLIDAVQAGLEQLAGTQPEAWQAWRTAHEDGPALVGLIPIKRSEGSQDRAAVRLSVVAPNRTVIAYDPDALPETPWSAVQAMIGDAFTAAVLTRLGAPTDEDPNNQSRQEHNDHDAQPATSEETLDTASLPRVRLAPTPAAQHLADVFSLGWARLTPLVFQQRVSTPFVEGIVDQPLTLTPAGIDRAARTVARHLSGRLPAGEHPVRVVRDTLCPTALDLLRAEAAAFDGRAALATACAELERALADRFVHSHDLQARLAGPWAQEALASADVMPDSYAARRARAAELLVECLIHDSPTGALTPDRRDIHRLLQLAAWPLDLALKAQQSFAGIQPCAVDVTEHGEIDLVPTAPPRVDLFRWRQAQWEDDLHNHADDERRAADGESWSAPATDGGSLKWTDPQPGKESGTGTSADPETSAFLPLRPELVRIVHRSGSPGQAAERLLAVDDALHGARVFNLDAVRAVLATTASWPVPDEPTPPVAVVRRAELITRTMEWSGLPETDIAAAVDACTLTADRLRAAGLRYWQLEKRAVRLALQPLVAPPAPSTPDELWLLPRRAHASLRILARYLGDGRLPWPDLPAPIRKAQRELRHSHEDGLEKRVRQAAEEAGLHCRTKLLPAKAARHDVRLAGEVDLLAAELDSRRLWVIEAKHLHEPFSPPEIALHVAGFHGHTALALDPDTMRPDQLGGSARPHVDQLLANTAAVRANIPGALRLLNLNEQADAIDNQTDNYVGAPDKWDVIPLIVTVHVEVAAFAQQSPVAMVAERHLTELLRGPRPSAGWWAPWTADQQQA